jgi:lipopolysaccharide export system permease protein
MLREYVVQVRTDLLSQVLQPGNFTSPEKGITFHIRERAPNGDILGLLMHDTRAENGAMSYLADRGQIVKQESGAYLVMSGGHVLSQDTPGEPARVIVFDRYALDLDEFGEKVSDDRDLRPRERYFSELINPDPASQYFKRNPGQFRTELHERFASTLYPLAFVFIALATAGNAQSTRQNRTRAVTTGFAAAAGLRLTGLGLNNLVATKTALLPLLYVLPLAGIIVSLLVILSTRRQPAGQSRLSQWIDALSDHFTAILARFRPANPDAARMAP